MQDNVSGYVHAYDGHESARLRYQAATLEALLHSDISYPDGSKVLEAGCGVGAQSIPLARNSPGARITSVDISAASLAEASARTEAAGVGNVAFVQADILDLPFAAESFDNIFVCFTLEHLPRPFEALCALKPLLRAGGTITVIEGDHGSARFHPESDAATSAIGALVELQRAAGGDPDIGRRLYPLMNAAGYSRVRVSPRLVYVDGGRPDLAEGFTRRTFAAMVEGVRDAAVEAGLIELDQFEEGLRALDRAAQADGVFCYTFFKAVAERDPVS
jgi:SAM-dependent methyltransferase